MQTRSRAYVVHQTRNRLRIKIPDRRHDHRFFLDLRLRLLQQSGVVAVEVNPLAASVLIQHGSAFGDGALRQPALGLEVVCSRPDGRSGAPDWDELVARIDRGLRAATGGEVGLGSLVLKLAIAFVIGRSGSRLLEFLADILLQAWAGQRAGPATATAPARIAPTRPAPQALLLAA